MSAASPEILNVSRETFELLVGYVGMVHKWNPAINLISKSSLPHIWERHVRDSLQIVSLPRTQVTTWVDLGSGGGFPGLVAAIVLKDSVPRPKVILVESDQRKVQFLRQVSRELDLGVEVIAGRVENVPALQADIVSARALAPLPELLTMAELHLARDGTCLFPKGERHAEEIDAARQNWSFRCAEIASITNPRSVILRIEEIARV